MLTSSLDSESLVRRRVCGLRASLWSGAVWWVVGVAKPTTPRAADSGSDRGAYFDSVSDRLTDAPLFGGVAWHLAVVRGLVVGCWG